MDFFQIKTPEAVNNDKLAKLGELRFEVNIDSVKSFFVSAAGIPSAKNTGMYIVGDGHFTSSDGSADQGKTKSYDLFSTMQVYLSPGHYTLVLTAKYYLKIIAITFGAKLVGGDTDAMDLVTNYTISNMVNNIRGKFLPKDFSASSVVATFISNGTRNVEGNFEDFGFGSSLSTFNVTGQDVSGDIKDVPANLTSLVLKNNPNFGGDIADATCFSLTNLDVSGTPVYGAVNDFLDAAYASGRTSGTMTILPNGIITMNGVAMFSYKTITFSAGGWSSN